MRTFYLLALITVLALGAVAPGCGCNKAGQLPPPPPGATPEPWAEWNKDVKPGGKASFKLEFADVNSNLIAATEIYMNLRDPYGRSAYNVTVKTDDKGVALFQDIPVGNYLLEFIDETGGRRSKLPLNLGEYTGAKAGTSAGTVNF